jgi:hypothetical protein
MTNNTGTAIMNRLIEPDGDDLSAAGANFILGLDFAHFDHARMAELSPKAQTGDLSADEQDELGEYLRAGDMLAILKLKARRSLDRISGT